MLNSMHLFELTFINRKNSITVTNNSIDLKKEIVLEYFIIRIFVVVFFNENMAQY